MTRTSISRRVAVAAGATLLAVAVVAAPAAAGKPGGGTTTSPFRIDDGAYGRTTTAYRGSSSATWVRARCSQNGKVVYEQYVAYGSGGTATLVLGPTPSWTGGGANCTGDEGTFSKSTFRVSASTTFSVGG